MITDKEKLLALLRDRGPAGVHTAECRRLGISGNPSQRRLDLIKDGYEITSEREGYKGRDGKTRPGARFTLKAEPDRGLGAGTADERPREPLAGALAESEQAASVEPGTGALFELPSYMDPDAYDSEAA